MEVSFSVSYYQGPPFEDVKKALKSVGFSIGKHKVSQCTIQGFAPSLEALNAFKLDGVRICQSYVSRLPKGYKNPFKIGDKLQFIDDKAQLLVTKIQSDGYMSGIIIESGEYGKRGDTYPDIGVTDYPYCLDDGWNPTLFRKMKDYPGLIIEEVRVHNGSFVVAWSDDDIGFGTLTFYNDTYSHPPEVKMDSEAMSPEFCKAVMNLVIDGYFLN